MKFWSKMSCGGKSKNIFRDGNCLSIVYRENNFRLSNTAHLIPKFHRLQKALNRTYALFPLFLNNPDIIRNISRNKTKLINELRKEARTIQASQWTSLMGKLGRDRTLDPKNFWKRIKPILGKKYSGKTKITY